VRSRCRGRLLSIGFAGGEIPKVPLNRLLMKNLDVLGAGPDALFTRPDLASEALQTLRRFVEEGRVRPIVGSELPLAEAASALELVASRRSTGKAVLLTR